MKRTNLYIATAVSFLAGLAMLALQFSPAGAATLSANANTTVGSKTKTGVSANAGTGTTNLDAIRTKADNQIDARVKSLNNLMDRIGEMKKLSDTDKSSLTTSIQASISDMTALKAKIDADTDLATLKTDAASVTKGYRIYMLVLPKGRIEAAADRIQNIIGLMNSLQTKIQSRIDEAKNNGQDVTATTSLMTDFNAKLADANTQAQAALTLVTALQPDNGDSATIKANTQALKDARAKIKLAIADLKAARQDAGKIVSALAQTKAAANANANANASVNSNSSNSNQ